MARLVVTAFVTLDGVIEAPGLEEHRTGRQGWALRRMDAEMERLNWERTETAGAILLGRKTYQTWAAYWPFADENDPHTKVMNELPKYVVSRTLIQTTWNNTTVLRGEVETEIARLKAKPGGDIVCYGSSELLEALLAGDLVDEFRLILFPVILGSGTRLFHDDLETRDLRLVNVQAFSTGALLLTYVPQAEVPTSEYVQAYSWTDEQMRSLHFAQNVDR